MSDDVCGSTDTSSGEPCQWNENERGLCPYHSSEKEDKPDTRNTLLEEDPSIIEVVSGEIQSGSTVREACAEANISYEGQYKKWYSRGKEEDAKDVFDTFRTEVTRAREVAKKSDRQRIERDAIEQGDLRLRWKIHMQMYGDRYDDAATATEDDYAAPFAIPEELAQQWQQQSPQ